MSEHEPDFEALLRFLAESRGFDFTAYKRTSPGRRVRKRMGEVGIQAFAEYQDYLEVHPDEFAHLFDTILINVTSFFRDRAEWEFLRAQVLQPLAEAVPQHEAVRIWSAGCASGEEAYTVAMLMADVLGADQFRQRVRIYATDVDEAALARARAGSYSAHEMESVPEDLLHKYFESSGSLYVFRSDLRRSLIFGRHDLVQDAPISRLDLLICRNTLMYFTAEIQNRVLARLHYALNPGGRLFLGKAEMLLTHADLFTPLDVRHRIFAKVPKTTLRDRLGVLAAAGQDGGVELPVGDSYLLSALDALPVAHLLVDPSGVLISASECAQTWFGVNPKDLGRPLSDLEISYRPVELRSLIEQGQQKGSAVNATNVERRTGNGDLRYYDVEVTPIKNGDQIEATSVVFSDVTRYHELQGELERSRQELETAYEELQSTNEELETTNEELQSTIEELETTNEELQSSNEELETMNEEMESTNAELQTMNDDLRRRTDEIDRINLFLNSVMGSLRLGVIVVNRALQVEMWNQRCEDLWGVRGEEAIGKALSNLDIGLPLPETLELVRGSLNSGEAREASIEAINRRGRAIRIRMIANRLMLPSGGGDGVILLLEQVEDATAS